MALKPEKFTRLTREELTEPKANRIVQVIRDNWWVVDEERRVYLFEGRSPQCNEDRAFSEKAMAWCPDAVGVERIPLAFVPVRMEDFR